MWEEKTILNEKEMTFELPGVDLGYPNRPAKVLKIQKQEDGELVVAVLIKGHRAWSGRGTTSYYPASICIYLLSKDKDNEDPTRYYSERLIEFPFRSKKGE
jgi:hypothetical protein